MRGIWNGPSPLGNSVNAEIPDEVRKVVYPSFKLLREIADAVGKVISFGFQTFSMHTGISQLEKNFIVYLMVNG